jgi:hypothetical protein
MAIEFNDRRNDPDQTAGSRNKAPKGPRKKGTPEEKKSGITKARAKRALDNHITAQHSKFSSGALTKVVDKAAVAKCATCAKLKSAIDAI